MLALATGYSYDTSTHPQAKHIPLEPVPWRLDGIVPVRGLTQHLSWGRCGRWSAGGPILTGSPFAEAHAAPKFACRVLEGAQVGGSVLQMRAQITELHHIVPIERAKQI